MSKKSDDIKYIQDQTYCDIQKALKAYEMAKEDVDLAIELVNEDKLNSFLDEKPKENQNINISYPFNQRYTPRFTLMPAIVLIIFSFIFIGEGFMVYAIVGGFQDSHYFYILAIFLGVALLILITGLSLLIYLKKKQAQLKEMLEQNHNYTYDDEKRK